MATVHVFPSLNTPPPGGKEVEEEAEEEGKGGM